jgi:hypothetical protein
MVFLFSSAFMYSLTTVRIVVSPNGISYHNMGLYAIHSTWKNIDRIGSVNFRGFGPQRCVILKEGQKLGWWSELAWALSKDERERSIPLPERQNWDKYNELKNDIKTYIPQITGLD